MPNRSFLETGGGKLMCPQIMTVVEGQTLGMIPCMTSSLTFVYQQAFYSQGHFRAVTVRLSRGIFF